jgi:cobalt-zinc-cadmium resistance protein CzcA
MLSRVIDLSVRGRWLVLLVVLVLAGFGVRELMRLPIDAVPDITNRQVQINTIASALGPEEVERQVTFPLETALAGLPGLTETRSLSRHGFSQITAIFTDATDIYFARNLVNERLQAARQSLPEGMTPSMGPVVTGLGEVYIWTVEFEPGLAEEGASYTTPEGETLSTPLEKATYLRTVQDWIIAPQLRGVKGVAGVDVLGGYVKEYAVHPDPAKLAAYGMGLVQLAEALEHANRIAGAGYVSRSGEAYVVRADARLRTLDELAQTPVLVRGGQVIRVTDVATVEAGRAPRLGSASSNGREVVVGTALMLQGENSREVAQRVAKRLEQIKASLPQGVVVRPALDRTKLVEATISTVEHNLTIGALLVIAVLFLALGNIRAAIITALVIPLSFLFAAAAMNRFHISGNLMSFGALDFGLIVDGAVVVIENTLRRIAHGGGRLGRRLTLAERLEAASGAAREMARPAAFGQAIILLVYAPLLAFEGVEGKMFAPMAATVMFALLGAFVLSFTFVPAMAALLIREPKGHGETPSERLARRAYQPVLRWAVARPGTVAASAGAAFVAGLVAFLALGREFAPTLDEGDVLVQALRIPSTSLEQSQDMQARVEKTLQAMPEVQLVFTRTGTAEIASDPMPPNASDTFVMLKPRSAWPDPGLRKSELVRRMEVELGKLLGNSYEFTQPIQMRFNELIAGVRSDVAVKVYGDDFDTMLASADKVADVLRSIPGAADVRVEQVTGQPTITARVDRVAAAAQGVHASDAADALAIGLGGRESGVVFEGDRRFNVVVRLADDLRNDPAVMQQLPVAQEAQEAGGGATIPLSAVARFDTEEGPNQISRENGKRRIVVQANVRGRDLGGFVAEARARVDSGVKLPPGEWTEWGGQFENLERATARLALIVPLVFLLIGVLLFLALGSGREAALVFAGVPLALVGGAIALLMRNMPFSISAAVGFIAVSGIATLNGLVLMQAIRQRLVEGASPAEAAIEGAASRLRAVLTTALVAMLGFIPMAIAMGPGAEVQKPLATVVIGGLATSTLLTLLVLPACFAWIARTGRPRSVG